ncbi:MAG: hypothetical protein KDD63_28755, partial [Bacteroidetes bacterium]|nr:hypothetical protein [Bacteroidota bacterium]
MKSLSYFLLASAALAFTACTGPRYSSSTEYDDVYVTSADLQKTETSNVNYQSDQDNYRDSDRNDNYAYNPDRYRRQVDNYYDEYYQEDDFYFSRRMRRFGNTN